MICARVSACVRLIRVDGTIPSTAHINILFKQEMHANMHSLYGGGGGGDGVLPGGGFLKYAR